MIYIAEQLIQIFSAGPASQPRGSEVVQEVLADLKIVLIRTQVVSIDVCNSLALLQPNLACIYDVIMIRICIMIIGVSCPTRWSLSLISPNMINNHQQYIPTTYQAPPVWFSATVCMGLQTKTVLNSILHCNWEIFNSSGVKAGRWTSSRCGQVPLKESKRKSRKPIQLRWHVLVTKEGGDWIIWLHITNWLSVSLKQIESFICTRCYSILNYLVQLWISLQANFKYKTALLRECNTNYCTWTQLGYQDGSNYSMIVWNCKK